MRCFRQIGILLLLHAAASAFAADIAVLRNGFEIRHQRRQQADGMTRLYLSAAPDAGYVDVPTGEIIALQHDDMPVMPAAPISPSVSRQGLQELVNAASDRHQVDADLVASVIRAESNFNPRALSPKGAQGLMQLMPGTASRLGVDDPFHPEANIDGGTRYLRELLLQYNGDVVKALAAYNAGPKRVEQYRGVPPYRETHAYVARIIRDFNRKKQLEKKTAVTAGQQPAKSKAARSRKRIGAVEHATDAQKLAQSR
jgi:soluble lytic murein transglycosylase-like protein